MILSFTFLAFVVVLIFSYTIATVVNIAHNFKHYSLYRKIYNKLPTLVFERVDNQLWIANKDYDFTYFIDKESICLVKDVYLHKTLTLFDPIYNYWHRKYVAYFKHILATKSYIINTY